MRVSITAAVIVGCAFYATAAQSGEPIRPNAPLSGASYASAAIRVQQNDETANPGMLWVTRGEALWNEPLGSAGKPCAQCHATGSMKGMATRYPKFDGATSKVINLEGQINRCRVKQQGADALGYESMELLALTSFVAHQSRGLPGAVVIDDKNRAAFLRGASLYQQRMGQINLGCTHCHDQYVGKTLLAEKISEGHPNAYPIYRLEWQEMGSLHRRFRSCLVGVRAEPFSPGGDEYLALELYLAWRAGGLPIETPGVRR